MKFEVRKHGFGERNTSLKFLFISDFGHFAQNVRVRVEKNLKRERKIKGMVHPKIWTHPLPRPTTP